MKLAQASLLLFTAAHLASAGKFISHEVATGLKGGYQVVAADLNHDGRPDLIAVAPGTNQLVWFENPGWQRHVILTDVPRMINCAAWDIDGDGVPEIALAYEFSNDAKKSLGIVVILRHDGDPTQPWKATEIDRLPTSHRLRWVDIDGSGKKVLLNAPLTNASSAYPEDRLRAPLVYYTPSDWKRHEIASLNEGVQHGIRTMPRGFLTASMSGISRFELNRNEWKQVILTRGSTEPWPKSGSSDITIGTAGKKMFLAAIEPWHGNQVVVYNQRKGSWKREVIDDSLADGHTIVSGDFTSNGNDQIVAGARGGGHSLHLYTLLKGKWSGSLIDEGKMGAAACEVADLSGDGRPDFACISPVTQNLNWYEYLASN